jgi:hypothetical protein
MCEINSFSTRVNKTSATKIFSQHGSKQTFFASDIRAETEYIHTRVRNNPVTLDCFRLKKCLSCMKEVSMHENGHVTGYDLKHKLISCIGMDIYCSRFGTRWFTSTNNSESRTRNGMPDHFEFLIHWYFNSECSQHHSCKMTYISHIQPIYM